MAIKKETPKGIWKELYPAMISKDRIFEARVIGPQVDGGTTVIYQGSKEIALVIAAAVNYFYEENVMSRIKKEG